MSKRIVIVGAGLAGLSAALAAAEKGCAALLVSTMPSERAQSVMAEGGINAALDTKGEHDSAAEHFADTIEAGGAIADPNAVHALTEAAPGIVRRLLALGVNFNLSGDNEPDLRNFGGQRKKRTAFAKSGTGKQIMTALIAEARKYEARGLIQRYPRHAFVQLLMRGGRAAGCVIRDVWTGSRTAAGGGAVIIAAGGMHGLFAGTTGSRDNTGSVTAALFRAGLPLVNGEFIQYHPTTAPCSGKRLLISEAARGEGGRLFVLRGKERRYFMEEKYGERGNLMSRDIVSREILDVLRDGTVFLDMTAIPAGIMAGRLSGIVEDCAAFLRIDPRKEPIPVSPGVHYFMGGLQVDMRHQTPCPGLYAAGECCAQYHGANRLGGNSLLGAIYGGAVAADSALLEAGEDSGDAPCAVHADTGERETPPAALKTIHRVMEASLGIVRVRRALEDGIAALEPLDGNLALLARAMLASALAREESRGAHCRADFPARNDGQFRKTTIARFDGTGIRISFEDIPERREP
jgi:succinate dehydrogenase / fumarate reductase flavoprotein subunit